METSETAEEIIEEIKGGKNLKSENKFEEKIKSWLSNKYHLYLLGIIILASVIRIYYFILTQDQPLWWDEAEYGAFAKNLAGGADYEISPKRLIFFPFLLSLVFRIGLGELSARFIWVLVPSVLVVLFAYLFTKELYDEKVALIVSFITSIFWIHLFYSMRLMNDELSFLFGIIGWFLFWKGYVQEKNNKYVYLSSLFLTLSFLARPAGIYYAAILIIFLFFTEQFRFLKKPQLWGMVLVFFIVISPHLIWSYFHHGNPIAFRTAYGGPGQEEFGWQAFSTIPIYTEQVFFIFFLIGLITLLPLIINFDKVIRGEKKYQADLLMVISILFNLAINIFLIKSFEDRWLMSMSVAVFVFSAKGIFLISKFVKKHFKALGKIISIIFILFILLWGAHNHLTHADQIIKLRVDSYAPVREAGFWIKENTVPEDIIFHRSVPQNTYYSERVTKRMFPVFPETEQEVIEFVGSIDAKYFVLSVFEEHPEFMYQIPTNYQNIFVPVHAYESNGQPVLVIYEVNHEELRKTFQESQ